MRDIAFCRQFPLDISLIARMLASIAQNPSVDDGTLAVDMGINPYKVTGYRGWFRKIGAGSGVSGNYHLSSFGQLISSSDPEIQDEGTKWLFHYYLVSQHEERAEVWYRCFNKLFYPNLSFTYKELQTYIERDSDDTITNKDGFEKDSKQLIKTYTDYAALGSLGLLTKPDQKHIVVGQPIIPNPFVVAFVLFDSWSRLFGRESTIRLSQITETPEMIGKVFVADPTQVRQHIITLQRYGFVTYADTQHEPVTRHFQGDPLELLERYYLKQG